MTVELQRSLIFIVILLFTILDVVMYSQACQHTINIALTESTYLLVSSFIKIGQILMLSSYKIRYQYIHIAVLLYTLFSMSWNIVGYIIFADYYNHNYIHCTNNVAIYLMFTITVNILILIWHSAIYVFAYNHQYMYMPL